MMAIILPAKKLGLAKTRLAQCLSPSQRRELSIHMLLRTVRVGKTVLDNVFVISQDESILQHARFAGATPVAEQGTNLNDALRQAARHAQSMGADGILILPSDLPLVTPDDVRGMLGFSEDRPVVVAAPSWRDGGTNGLLIRPMTLVPFVFGPGSFSRHIAAAEQRGIDPIVYRSDTLSLDLDTPADWRETCARTGQKDFRGLIAVLDAPLPMTGIDIS